jgi:acid phosphatase
VKKYFLILVAVITTTFVSTYSAGQKPASKQAAPLKQQPVFSVDAPAERIPNLDILKKEIKQYHDCTCKCGCYTHDIDAQADRAIAFLRRRAAHQHAPGRPVHQEKLVMVFDIDETSLSNYPEMLKADFAYDSKVFDAWVQSAQAPAIPGTLRVYKEAQKLGVSVFFITGRPEDERDATERNLHAQGFENWQQLTLRKPTGGLQSTSEYKSAVRAQIVAEGYRIVLNVGDQWSDLKGKPEAEFSVKYPDPFYFLP